MNAVLEGTVNAEGFPGGSESKESACDNTEVLHDQLDE